MTEQTHVPGIARSNLYHIPFYESIPFNGSYRGMHYRIEGIPASVNPSESEASPSAGTRQDAQNASLKKGEKQLCVTVWPGPCNYAATDDSKKVTAYFPFSNEGLDAVTDYLNQYYEGHFA